MRRICIVVVALAAALSLTAVATAGTVARDPRVPALQAKVAALQAQVNQNANVLNAQIDLNACKWTYQSHFNYAVLNIFATIIGTAGYPDQTASDNGACSRVGISPPAKYRLVEGVTVYTPRAPFGTLVGWLAAIAQ